jgi:hypothetical protein
MKRSFLLLVLAFAGASPLLGQTKPIITVLDFKTDALSQTEMKTVISLLSSALFRTGRYTIIDVTQRENLLKEIEFSSSGCTEEACALKIGKLLSAGMIVVGNLSKMGSRFVVSTKLLETESGKTLSTADGIYGSMDALVDGVQDLAEVLAGQKATTRTGGQAQPGAGPDLKFIAGVACGVAGLGLGGMGGWLLYDGLVNGKAVVDADWNAYYKATANHDALYQTYQTALQAWVNGLWLAGGLAAGGAALTGLGVVLMLPAAVPPGTAVSIFIQPCGNATLLSVHVGY